MDRVTKKWIAVVSMVAAAVASLAPSFIPSMVQPVLVVVPYALLVSAWFVYNRETD